MFNLSPRHVLYEMQVQYGTQSAGKFCVNNTKMGTESYRIK